MGQGVEVSRQSIGAVKGGKSGKRFPVGYNPKTKTVCVDLGGMLGSGWTTIGATAKSPQEAMMMADAWVWDR